MFSPSEEESRRRRRKSRSKSTSKSQKRSRDHDGQKGAVQPDPERPATVEELRKARLIHIEAESTQVRSRTRQAHARTSSATVQTSKRDEVHSRSQPRSDQVRSGYTRRKRQSSKSGAGTREKEVNSTDDQYVYRSSTRPARENTTTVIAQDDGGENVPPPLKRRSSTSDHTRRSSVRRHTSSPVRRESILTARHPAPSFVPGLLFMRRNSTASELSRPTTRRDQTARRAKSEVANAAPSPTPAPAAVVPQPSPAHIPQSEVKRPSSILNGIFSPKPKTASPVKEKKVSCLTCGDDVSRARTAKLPCTHRMCHECLKRIFKLSITDPAHMPPRCCTEQAIDLKHVNALFDNAFKKTWNRKFKEHKAKNRIYCPRKGCGEWVQPKHMTIDKGRKIGRCPSCRTHVCGICSQKMHKSRDCPKDPALQEFAEVAEKSGWRKCYSCSAMVELKEGCNHMTCRCTAEFCMVCGLKWKSCDCPWFSYEPVDINGDPVRYQQEMDRRREQEHRDEEIARRMEALDLVQANGDPELLAGHQLNDNLFQQAREALTANYRVADEAARGLFNGIFNGRETRGAGLFAQAANDQPPLFYRRPTRRRQQQDHDPAEGEIDALPMGMPFASHMPRRVQPPPQQLDPFANRPQTEAERTQERRMRAWADQGYSE